MRYKFFIIIALAGTFLFLFAENIGACNPGGIYEGTWGACSDSPTVVCPTDCGSDETPYVRCNVFSGTLYSGCESPSAPDPCEGVTCGDCQTCSGGSCVNIGEGERKDCSYPNPCQTGPSSTCDASCPASQNVADGTSCGGDGVCVDGNCETGYRSYGSAYSVSFCGAYIRGTDRECNYEHEYKIDNNVISARCRVKQRPSWRTCLNSGTTWLSWQSFEIVDCVEDAGENAHPSCVEATKGPGNSRVRDSRDGNYAFCKYLLGDTTCTNNNLETSCDGQGRCIHISETSESVCQGSPNNGVWVKHLAMTEPSPNTQDDDDDVFACCVSGAEHGTFIGTDLNEELGVCIGGDFVRDGDVSEEACKATFNYLHDSSTSGVWATGDFEGRCCGDDLTDPGSVGTDGNVDFVCTVSATGRYDWKNTVSDAGKVFNVTHKSTFWTQGVDVNGASSNDDYSYLVGVSESGVVACDPDGDFNNFDIDDKLTLNQVKNFPEDGRGFLCAGNEKLSVKTDGSYESIVDESLPGSPMMFVCGNADWDIDSSSNNAKKLKEGDYVSVNNHEPWFCTINGFIRASELDQLDGNLQSIEYTFQDYSCDLVNLESAYGVHGYSILDRFWRTGSHCCGNRFFDGTNVNFEFFSDTTHVGLGYRACWNNRGIADGYTISEVPTNRWGTPDSNTKQINLLRLDTHTFRVEGNELRNWDYTLQYGGDDVTSGVIDDHNGISGFFNSQSITFSNNIAGKTDFDEVVLISIYPIHLVKGIDYVLFGEIEAGDEVTFEIDFVDDHDETYKLSLTPTPPHIMEEFDDYAMNHFIFRPENTGNYKLRIVVESSEPSSQVFIENLKLVPRPSVLNDGGNLLVCKNKFLSNSLIGFRSTITEDTLFDNVVNHCTQESGAGFVCSPEGVWIDSTDFDSPNNRRFSQISRSPNIIEDSSFKYGYSFLPEGCDYVANQIDKFHETSVYSNRDERMDGDDFPGRGHLDCIIPESPSQVSFRDTNNQSLEGDYIFSAWVLGSGEISIGENSVSIPTSDRWNRIEVYGTANEDGDVVVLFSGTFAMDMVQLEEKVEGQFERGNYFRTDVRRACCPDNSCWNGHECVYMDRHDSSFGTYEDRMLAEPGFETNNGEMGYICADGNFSFKEKSYRWTSSIDTNRFGPNVPEHGFCDVGSCFLGRDRFDISSDSASIAINRTDCLSNGEFFQGQYCDNGIWRTNLERVASTLLDVNTQETYSLYCGDYRDVLNYYEYDFTLSQIPRERNLFNQLVFDENFKIPYVDFACVLKYGDDIVIGIPLNENLTGDVYDTESPLLTSVLKYFGAGVRPSATCLQRISERFDGFVLCHGQRNILYNPSANVLLYVSNNAMRNVFLETPLDDFGSLEQASWIEPLKDFFYIPLQDGEIREEQHYVRMEGDSENQFINRVNFSISAFTNYDELFVFENGNRHMYVARQRILDTEDLQNNYNYVYMINMTNIEIPSIYTVAEGYFSPINIDWNLTLSDVFNQTKGTILDKDNDGVYVLSVTRERDNEFFKDWHTFTGRLRGDFQLPR